MAKGDKWIVIQPIWTHFGTIRNGSDLEETGVSIRPTTKDVIVSDILTPSWHCELDIITLMSHCMAITNYVQPMPFEDLSNPVRPGAILIMRCECGAESIGHPGHSTWCPMHGDA